MLVVCFLHMNVGKVSVSLCWFVANSFWHYLSDPRNQTHCFSRGRCCSHLLLNTRKLGGEANFYNWHKCGSQMTFYQCSRWPCYFFCVLRLALTDLLTILSILFQRSCAFVFILICIFSLISLVLKEEWVQCAKLMIAA